MNKILRQTIYNTPFYGSLQLFSEWLYESKELEEYLSYEDYLNLIGIDYRDSLKGEGINTAYNRESFQLAQEILLPYLDGQKFLTIQLINLLKVLLSPGKNQTVAFEECLYLFKYGYFFLAPLIDSFKLNHPGVDLESLEVTELCPATKTMVLEVISWLEKGAIVFTGDTYVSYWPMSPTEEPLYCYFDRRTAQERQSFFLTDELLAILPEFPESHSDFAEGKFPVIYWSEHEIPDYLGYWLESLLAEVSDKNMELIDRIVFFLNEGFFKNHPYSERMDKEMEYDDLLFHLYRKGLLDRLDLHGKEKYASQL